MSRKETEPNVGTQPDSKLSYFLAMVEHETVDLDGDDEESKNKN